MVFKTFSFEAKKKEKKIEITELILKLQFIYETATASTPLSSHAVRTPATANRPGNGRMGLRAPGFARNRVALARPPLATLPWSPGRPPRRPPCATPPKRRRRSPSTASAPCPAESTSPGWRTVLPGAPSLSFTAYKMTSSPLARPDPIHRGHWRRRGQAHRGAPYSGHPCPEPTPEMEPVGYHD